jgi:hypothetical protein
MVQLRVQAKRARKAKTRVNEKYLKMSRKQLENFLEQEKRLILGSSITRYVIEADASDEERGKLKREQFIERMERIRRKRAGNRKAQRRSNLKRKTEAEQELVHIDEILKIDSGSSVKIRVGPMKMRRTERHPLTAKIGKAVKKAENSQCKAKRIEDRKWEKDGKNTMAKWLSSGISKRDNRKENPDRDKEDSYSTKAECLDTHCRSMWTIGTMETKPAGS